MSRKGRGRLVMPSSWTCIVCAKRYDGLLRKGLQFPQEGRTTAGLFVAPWRLILSHEEIDEWPFPPL